MGDVRLTGGCQCGAVRYALNAEPTNPCFCACRMCQKQFGNLFGSFAGVHSDDFEVTRGAIAWFRSSDEAERGFCRDCGTPLAYRFVSQPRTAAALGSLDHPEAIRPVAFYGVESLVPWFDEAVARMPRTVSGAGDNGVGDTPERFDKIGHSSRQHPDHDTAAWTPHPSSLR
jgi:hypothetical protein